MNDKIKYKDSERWSFIHHNDNKSSSFLVKDLKKVHEDREDVWINDKKLKKKVRKKAFSYFNKYD